MVLCWLLSSVFRNARSVSRPRVVPESIAARVAAATPPELERWGDRVLDAVSLDDVFAGE